jgi:ferric-dicitrate binding protein FerR (iron transport regulator)
VKLTWCSASAALTQQATQQRQAWQRSARVWQALLPCAQKRQAQRQTSVASRRLMLLALLVQAMLLALLPALPALLLALLLALVAILRSESITTRTSTW